MARGLRGGVASVKVLSLVLDVNQIFLLHYAIELHVALVLLPNIGGVHRDVAVPSDPDADSGRGTAREDRQEGEHYQQDGVCL